MKQSFPKHILILLLLSAAIALAVACTETSTAAQQAALVVQDDAGQVQTACVTFDEPEISGNELLLRSGLDVVMDVQGMGALVCQIEGAGCPANDCLCQCKGGGSCVYWSYWHQDEGEWRYAQTGASLFPVTDGMVQGWVWGPGAVDQAQPPPATTFAEVCQSAATAVATQNETAVSWLPYALFLAVALGLGLLIVRRQRGTA